MVHHTAKTKTSEDGSFIFEHLLPKTISSGEPIPYRFSETVYFAGEVPGEESREFLSVVRRELNLFPGKTAVLELVGLPRSRTIVKGRILMADGSPASYGAIQETFGKRALLHLSPSRGDNASHSEFGYASGGVAIQLEETGQFEARIPIAGQWKLGGFLAGGPWFAGKVDFIPVEVSGKPEIADLGDFYLFKAPFRGEDLLPRGKDGILTASVQVLGPGGKPVSDAEVVVEHLIVKLEDQSQTVSPETPLRDLTGPDGWSEIPIPAQRKDQNGNFWNIDQLIISVRCPGFESVTFPVDLKQPVARVSIRGAQ
jgi:hypothetical protein